MNMKKFNFKGCPRCGGDMVLESGFDGLEEVCLQCGHRNYSVNEQHSSVHDEVEQIMGNYESELAEASSLAESDTDASPWNEKFTDRDPFESSINAGANRRASAVKIQMLSHIWLLIQRS